MKPVSIWSYIWVGTCVRFLQDVREGLSIHKPGFVMDNIKYFFDNLDSLGLHVTKRASNELEEMRTTFKALPPDAKLTKEQATNLSNIMNKIRNTFTAESSGIYAYIVTEKKFDVKKLLEAVDKLFTPDVFANCPDIACYDFREAGRCIAFGLPTASAFHILRGTEAVLRQYYKRFIRPAKVDLTWGQILSELKSKKSGKKPDSVLLNNLQNIKDSFRNPTQHPDKIYDIHEVQDLFSLCIDVVNRMVAVIAKK
ncbi:MAG TPA: hypothetical protein VEI96_04060 [Thermodesulfovibrionales bacterium]|nr:hypothetical protein [Thermodesulfovibrionales bacterium]